MALTVANSARIGRIVDIRETARLRLVPIGPELAAELFELFQDPGIARWYGGAWTRAQAEETAAEMGRGWQVDGVHKWLAYRRGTGEIIGRGGLSLARTENGPQLELGWAVRERYWGHGYATEIGAAGLAFAFGELGADHVISFTEPHNARSRAVMVRLGFTFSGDFRHNGENFVLYTLDAHSPGATSPVS